MTNEPFELKKYYALAIDPIHVGTGGARLGRVDLPIIREPGTNLPKIPGSGLNGPARAYTALATNRYNWKRKENDKTNLSCAGRGGEGGENHCGDSGCPVCVPFGFSKGTGHSLQGLAQFFDAHILFFPVASMAGPVWVTSPLALGELARDDFSNLSDDHFYPFSKSKLSEKERLNFGWLLLQNGFKEVQEKNEAQKNSQPKSSLSLEEIPEIPSSIKERIVLVSDKLFSIIVNSNLEVRTSVSIDPATGAAEEGALFAYEAIPRGTVLRFEINYNSGHSFKIRGEELQVDTEWVKTQVEQGLALFEQLGVGGMNTRGMGRLKVLNIEKKQAGD